jgi:hypothetical protein
MIPADCYYCKKELKQPGAVLYGPPIQQGWQKGMMVEKRHVCTDCYDNLGIAW